MGRVDGEHTFSAVLWWLSFNFYILNEQDDRFLSEIIEFFYSTYFNIF